MYKHLQTMNKAWGNIESEYEDISYDIDSLFR